MFHIKNVECSPEDFNKILDRCNKTRKYIDLKKYNNYLKNYANIKFLKSNCAVLNEGRTNVELLIFENNCWTKYITYLDARPTDEWLLIDPMQSYSILNRYCKIDDLTKKPWAEHRIEEVFSKKNHKWAINDLGAKIYINQNYNMKRTPHCYGYDINSSFAFSMCKKMPDTSEPYFYRLAKDGLVGFDSDGVPHWEDYNWHDFVFPIRRYFGFYKFAISIYNKRLTNDPIEKKKYKNLLNQAIGMIQHHNPFIRNTIVHHSIVRINKYIDDNTIMSNTDSIYSAKKRTDLPIGEKIGDFKIEHNNESLAIKDSSYQWGYNLPSVRGVSQEWLKQFNEHRKFDLLVDKMPEKSYNIYILRRTKNGFKTEIQKNQV